MMRPFFIVLLATLSLGACDPRFIYESNLSPREIQSLAGTWEGQSALKSGKKECPAHYLLTFRVANGNVEGDLVDKDTPNAPRSRFTTFLDYDGGMTVLARPGGRDTNIRGAFQRDIFVGETKSEQCTYTVRLRRTA